MSKNNALLITLVLFLIGIGIGYSYAAMRGVNTITEPIISESTTHTMDHSLETMPMNASHMEQMMMDMNAALMGKSGEAFDKAFIEEMILHHEGAVEMAKQALLASERAEIRNLANAIIEAQNREIQEMKQWKEQWYQENE